MAAPLATHHHHTADHGYSHRRAHSRREVTFNAIAHCRGRFQSIVIRDISRGGMKLQNAFAFMSGDMVRVELLTGRGFEGRIAWSIHPFCGFVFQTLIDEWDALLGAGPRIR